MKTVFIIGGMGSGKSTVTKLFAEFGAPTIDLDVIGHEILTFDDTKHALEEAFGADIFDGEGNVVRGALATKAFASDEATAQLNSISMTRIVRQLDALLREFAADGASIVAVEVSAYDGPNGWFANVADAVVAVVAPEEKRIARAVAKGFDEADVRRRLAQQATDTERRAWADYVIENDSDFDALRDRAMQVWKKLSVR
ncbi:MAG: dephospho-CoA kinase [Raoultibacter sp.]